eukprot:288394-Prymnesium_polylepis.1
MGINSLTRWPTHVESTRFLVLGKEFEPGECTASTLLTRAPTQPSAGEGLPYGLACDRLCSPRLRL